MAAGPRKNFPETGRCRLSVRVPNEHLARSWNLSGDTCFRLDGHDSVDDTLLEATKTLIAHELAVIKTSLALLDRCVMSVDDFRYWDSVPSKCAPYPAKKFLVDFVTRNSLSEH